MILEHVDDGYGFGGRVHGAPYPRWTGAATPGYAAFTVASERSQPRALDPLPVGLVVLRNRIEEIVEIFPVGTALPAVLHRRFALIYEGMTAVRLEITVGAGTTRPEVTVLGNVELLNLPPAPKNTPVDVVFDHRGDTLAVTVTVGGTTTRRDFSFTR